MALNDLKLSPELIARLYPTSLVTPEDNQSPVQSIPISQPKEEAVDTAADNEKEAWKSLGNNQRNILIVVRHDGLVHLPDEELEFLTNMLTACKLSLNDVAIINSGNYRSTGYKEILGHFKSEVILLFGIDPLSFGLPAGFPPFQVQNLAGSKFLFAPALVENRDDKLLKSKLWVSLRSIFGI